MSRSFLPAFLALAIMSQTGCGVMFFGTHQDVDIECSEPTAKLSVDGRPIHPGKIRLERRVHHVVRAEAPGFKTTGAVIDNKPKMWVLFLDSIWILLGLREDDGAYSLEPKDVRLVMERDPDARDGDASR